MAQNFDNDNIIYYSSGTGGKLNQLLLNPNQATMHLCMKSRTESSIEADSTEIAVYCFRSLPSVIVSILYERVSMQDELLSLPFRYVRLDKINYASIIIYTLQSYIHSHTYVYTANLVHTHLLIIHRTISHTHKSPISIITRINYY